MAEARHSKLKRGIWAAAATAAVLAAALLAAALLLHHRPQWAKPWIEKALGDLAGAQCSIEKWELSLRPLHLEVAGIRLFNPRSAAEPLLRVARMKAQGVLEGPFGRRTLKVRRIRLQGLALFLSQGQALPRLPGIPAKRPGLAARAATFFMHMFLFRNLLVEELKLSGGSVRWDTPAGQLRITQIQGGLDAAKRLGLDGKARVRLRGGAISVRIPHWELTTASLSRQEGAAIEGFFRSSGCSVAGPPVQTKSLALEARFRYDPAASLLTLPQVEMRADETDWFQGAASLSAAAGAEARLLVRQKKLRLSRFHLRLGKLMEAVGDAELEMEPVPRMRVHLNQGTLLPAEAPPLLLPRPWRERLQVAGPVQLGGTVEGRFSEGSWQWRMEAGGRLPGNALAFHDGRMQLTATGEAEIHASGTFPAMELDARLKIRNMGLDSPGFRIDSAAGALSLVGAHPVYRLRRVELRIPRARFRTEPRWLEWKAIRISTDNGLLDARRWAVSLPHTELRASGLRLLSLAIHADRNAVRADYQTVGLEAAAAARLPAFAGWRLEGRIALKGAVTLTAKGAGTFSAQAAAEQMGFENPSGDWVGEGLAAEFEAQGSFLVPGPSVEGRLRVAFRGGEILLYTLYADLSETPLSVSLEGALDLRGARAVLRDSRLELQNVLKAAARGSAQWGGAEWRLRASLAVPDIPMAPLFDYLIREPLQATHPMLAALRVEGSLGAEFSMRAGRKDRELRGFLRWSNGLLAHADPAIRAEGIQITLPLWYASGTPSRSERPLQGAVRIRSLHLPGLPEQDLQLSLQAMPDRLAAGPAGPLQLPGGRVELGPCRLSGLFTGQPLVETRLRIDALALGPWLSRFWASPVQGTLSGELKPIRLRAGRLSSGGGLHARVFGGEVFMSTIRAAGLFGPAPSVTVDARWQDIDLARLTDGTPFGTIEGRLKGKVEGLELAFGQPERFELLMETVKHPGVPQRISVKAVDNIALIGGGQSPFVGLAGRLAALFKTFRYDRIGIRASLVNDVFTIRGTIHEKGREFLVKKSGFSGVDVVNQNPDNRISFRDMLKRIKRVRAQGGGPIIR